MNKQYTKKTRQNTSRWSVYLLMVMMSFSVVKGWGQTNRYGTGTFTWNNTNTNFGTTTGVYTGSTWLTNAIANLEGTTGTVTINGFNPNVGGIVSTASGLFTIASNASERLMLTGSSTPTINTGSNGITINSIIGGGMGFTKSGSGTLTFGQASNTFHGTVNISGGTITFPDNASVTANSALRHNAVNISSGTLSYTGSTNAADFRMGTLSGAGTVTASGAAANGIFGLLTSSGSSSATISTGSNGYTVRGMGGYVQTLTGNLTGVGTAFQVNGILNAITGSSPTSSTNVTLSGASNCRLNSSSMVIKLLGGGGRLTLDNTTNNDASRLGTGTSNTVDLRGGILELLGNASGTSQSVNSTSVGLIARSLSNQVIVNTPSSATSNTELVFGSSGSILVYELIHI